MGAIKGQAHNQNSNARRKSRETSIQRTIDMYMGKEALLKEWEGVLPSHDPYVIELRRKVAKYKNLLRNKNVSLNIYDDEQKKGR